jgi:VWFA-related protein
MAVREPFPRALHVALTCALLAAPSGAQQQDEGLGEEVFMERVAVDIVNVEVYVRDNEGNPVGDLTREDFLVTEDGKPVEVVNFYRVADGQPAAEFAPAVATPSEETPAEETPDEIPPPSLPPRQTEEIVVPESQRLHLIVYVDNFNIHPLNRNRVFSRLRVFLRDTLSSGDEVMVASYERSLHIRQPFTSRTEAANAVLFDLEKMSGSAIERESERADALKEIYETNSLHTALFRAKQFSDNQLHEMGNALDALEEMLDSLAGLPGRKMLIHLSDGIPMVPGQDLYQAIQQRFADNTALGEAFTRDMSRRYTRLIARANSNRISFYTIDAGGLRTRSGMGAENPAVDNMTPTSFVAVDGMRTSNLQGTLKMMANRTGGQSILNTNDVTAGLQRVARDFGNYYSLGYRAPMAHRGRYHKIEVRLKAPRKGWSVRHREGYRDKSPVAQMQDSINAFLIHDYTTNPLGVSIALGQQTPAADGRISVPVRVRIPLERIVLLPRGEIYEARLSIYFGATDEQGRDAPMQDLPLALRIPASSVEMARRDEVARVIEATMRPGPHKLVVGVRDEIGEQRSVVGQMLAVGSADRPMEQALPEVLRDLGG